MAKKPPKVEQIKVGDVLKADSLTFRAHPKRGSQYDAIYAKMAKLKIGQAFLVPIPDKIKPRVLQNRITAALRRGPVQPPEGGAFRKKVTADNQIAVCCVTAKDAEEADAKDAKKKGTRDAKALKKFQGKAVQSGAKRGRPKKVEATTKAPKEEAPAFPAGEPVVAADAEAATV